MIFTQQSKMRLIVVSNTWSISLQWCNLEGKQNLNQYMYKILCREDKPINNNKLHYSPDQNTHLHIFR